MCSAYSRDRAQSRFRRGHPVTPSRGRHVLGWIERSVLEDRPVDARVLLGPLRRRTMRLNRVTDTKAWLGIYERDVARTLAALCDPARPAWDVGACYGCFTVLLAERSSGVVAVEPDPRNAIMLRRTLQVNRLTGEVVEAAVTGENGTLRFASMPDPKLSRRGDDGSLLVPDRDS